jgi:DNA topoisomerase-6 subunit B
MGNDVVKTAEQLAEQMRAVSPAEFFEKNRHLLGYENTTKALITIVKELIDNSLDAANEAGITPTITVNVRESGENRYKITVEDNGPGIVHEKVPQAFGQILYGSKFHRLVQGRGTQGIGATGAILYSQLTTGKPTKITSSTGKDVHVFELLIDTAKNQPHILKHEVEKNPDKWHGIKVELEAEARFVEKGPSVYEYLKQTAMTNPYAKIVYKGPNGQETFNNITKELPKRPKEIKPHPYGVELGILRRMILYTKARNTVGFLISDFSRVGKKSALQIVKLARIPQNKKPKELTPEDVERMHKAIQQVKLIAPPTDCLSPLGDKLLAEGLKKQTEAEFSVAVTRPPSVYRGNPFLIEVGLAFGGKIAPDQTAQLYRFSNKVPLLYNQGECATTEAVVETDWRRYGFSQSNNQLPIGPLAILIHFASVWVPYTSEGKQAIAKYPEITKEIKLALQEAGRKIATYVRKQAHLRAQAQRTGLFEKYIPEIANAIAKLTESNPEKLRKELNEILNKPNILQKREDENE